MPGRPWNGLACLVVLALLCQNASAYQGFDCSQGSATLRLANYKCSMEVHRHLRSCFHSLALRVKHCTVKAWPHPHQSHRSACWGIQLQGNVTDVNHAQGTLHMHGSNRHGPLSFRLEYSRPDETMHVSFGGNGGAAHACTLQFEAQTASDASLRPVPGEDGRGMSSLLGILLPAVLVPCVIISVVVGLGAVSARSGGPSAPGSMCNGPSAAEYSPLAAGPSSSCVAMGQQKSASHSSGPGGLGLLKAMSRRARARRMRRSCRPAYVGLPEQSQQQHREYVSGRLQPGPFNLVAPFFKFPPVAVPPALEAIPESNTPSCSSSASRASSSQELSLSAADLARCSPLLDAEEVQLMQAEAAAGGSSDDSSSASLQGVDLPQYAADAQLRGTAWAWNGQLFRDAEQGGAAGS